MKATPRASPRTTRTRRGHIYDGNDFSERYLLADVFNMDLSAQTSLGCPLILLSGGMIGP
ncbi:MAG TPA: hypothetical protein VGI93_05100 [Steroidobacteraceae bacterium]|jgi:hypothetical protein